MTGTIKVTFSLIKKNIKDKEIATEIQGVKTEEMRVMGELIRIKRILIKGMININVSRMGKGVLTVVIQIKIAIAKVDLILLNRGPRVRMIGKRAFLVQNQDPFQNKSNKTLTNKTIRIKILPKPRKHNKITKNNQNPPHPPHKTLIIDQA